MSQWKFPDALGFSTLIDFIKQTKKTSDANASDVSDLQGDIQGLTDETTNTFKQVDDALAAMDEEKLDKTNAVSASIPITGWGEDTSVADYPKYYDLAVESVAAVDKATVLIAPASAKAAVSCGLCATCETLAGVVRIRAEKVPEEALSVQYWIEKGKE